MAQDTPSSHFTPRPLSPHSTGTAPTVGGAAPAAFPPCGPELSTLVSCMPSACSIRSVGMACCGDAIFGGCGAAAAPAPPFDRGASADPAGAAAPPTRRAATTVEAAAEMEEILRDAAGGADVLVRGGTCAEGR